MLFATTQAYDFLCESRIVVEIEGSTMNVLISESYCYIVKKSVKGHSQYRQRSE